MWSFVKDYFTCYATTGLKNRSIHKLVISWLSEAYQKVLDGPASDLVPALSHITQGSVLGPVLFLIFMIFRTIPGHLFAYLLMIMFCIGICNMVG